MVDVDVVVVDVVQCDDHSGQFLSAIGAILGNMADTTARTLRLLSFLQRRHFWPGEELAARLEVSDRTLRRDIERLRELGYTVESNRGVDGGYRLGASSGDAMLLLDNDEATALAAALHQAAAGTSELAEASLGALTKVLTMLGPAQRHRAETVRSTTSFGSPPDPHPPQLAILNTVAAACRDCVALSFDYLAADATPTSRYVEPCQLVALDTRWYLVAYDRDRADWRTFRIDRMSNPVPARNTFTPRPAPATDLYEYVRFDMSEPNPRHQVVVDIDLPGQHIRDEYGTWVHVEDLARERCRLTMETDNTFRWPTHIVANLDVDYIVIAPPAFRQHLLNVAAKIHVATTT
jgi:predicted DNA-binding transcriptional regulator YafY